MMPSTTATTKGARDSTHARDIGRGRGPQERRLGIAVDAPQGNLSRGGFDFRTAVAIVFALAPLGRLDLEFSALVKRFVALQVRSICIAPCRAAVIVHVARAGKRHDERCGLDVVEFGDVGG